MSIRISYLFNDTFSTLGGGDLSNKVFLFKLTEFLSVESIVKSQYLMVLHLESYISWVKSSIRSPPRCYTSNVVNINLIIHNEVINPIYHDPL